MKTTREVFIIIRAGKVDKRDHETAKKPHNLSICKQYVRHMASRHVTSFYVGNAFKINKKTTLISQKSMKQ